MTTLIDLTKKDKEVIEKIQENLDEEIEKVKEKRKNIKKDKEPKIVSKGHTFRIRIEVEDLTLETMPISVDITTNTIKDLMKEAKTLQENISNLSFSYKYIIDSESNDEYYEIII